MISNKNTCVMKTAFVVELALLCVFLSSCNNTHKEPVKINEGQMNAGLVSAYNDTAMENAIIVQHSLYPYHFVNNSEQLNELGRRDLLILAKHFKEYPGQIDVSRDGTNASLYQARLAYVAGQLKKDGVDISKVTISDGLPGGSGMTSSDVGQIMEADQKVRSERRQSIPDIGNNSSNSSSSGSSR
jgi:hypothetical protein